ncbi:MAG: putative oxidoreductase C-terminal domain-containing protein [Chitinophagaceae bacterium]
MVLALMVSIASCTDNQADKAALPAGSGSLVKLVTLDPGHFHAALVQKSMYPGVDSIVHVYAPDGPDLKLHLDKIEAENTRAESPTHWKEIVYKGPDFLEKMLAEKAGNVVVMAGNNEKKTEYILKSVEAGFNVLADKPMVIDKKNFELLKQAFDKAKANKVLIYDIMTERYEITTELQRELSMMSSVFGTLEKGTAENPAVTKESVHNFFKFVSGKALQRPPWFMDVSQEGEGIVDVTTHLVDLVQWECFPGKIIDYTKDIQVNKARRWTTDISLSQFTALTALDSFPAYLLPYAKDSILKVYCNGEMNYTINGIHAKVSVTWNYKAPEGAGDTHYSIMRGTRSNLVIRQGAEQKYKPSLYIEPVNKKDAAFETELVNQFKPIQAKYPGVELVKNSTGWEVSIPDKYREGHESHFARVTEKYLQYLKDGKLPDWEVPNMLAKYYTTTAALELAQKGSK